MSTKCKNGQYAEKIIPSVL